MYKGGRLIGSLKLSSLGVGLSPGLCRIVSLTLCRPTCYPSFPCPLSLKPVLPEPHPRATISGCQESNGKSQQKFEGREQSGAKVFIPLAAPAGSSQVGCVPQFEAMFLSRWPSACGFWKLLPWHPSGARSGNSSPWLALGPWRTFAPGGWAPCTPAYSERPLEWTLRMLPRSSQPSLPCWTLTRLRSLMRLCCWKLDSPSLDPALAKLTSVLSFRRAVRAVAGSLSFRTLRKTDSGSTKEYQNPPFLSVALNVQHALRRAHDSGWKKSFFWPSWVPSSVLGGGFGKRVRGLYCDTVIYKKYVLGLCPCFWHRAPKTLGISEVMGVIKFSFVMLM